VLHIWFLDPNSTDWWCKITTCPACEGFAANGFSATTWRFLTRRPGRLPQLGGALPSTTTKHCASKAASTIAKDDYIAHVCTVQAVLHDCRRIVWTLTFFSWSLMDRYQEINKNNEDISNAGRDSNNHVNQVAAL
jgi:hypothetical protein